MKRLNPRRPLGGQPLHALSAVVFLLFCTSAGAQLYYDARGTGRTTGTVANVRVYNPTPTLMRVVLGDCFIPAASGYQGYVIPQTYPLEILPFSSEGVVLEGYCVNMGQPPAPDGGSLPDVLQWVSWAAAAPLPEAGKPLGPPFVLVAAVPDDPLAMTYPGTQTPMPYALDFNRYPHYGARLLLHAAYAAGEAFDQLVREGKINAASMGRSLQSLRQDLIQQSVWVQAARLEGKAYGKGHFHAQLLEEAEHQLNQPASAFAPDVRQALDRQSQDVWASVSLVGATAKLVPPSTEPRLETLRPEPTVQPIDIPTALLDRLRGTAPTQPDAIERLTPVQVFLQSHNDAPEYQALALASLEKWRAALQHLAERLDPQSPTAVRDALTAIGWVQSLPSQGISADERQHLLTTLHGKTSAAIQHTAAALRPQQPDFLAQWRALKAIADQPWYDACCRQTNPLLKLPNPMDAVRSAAPFQPATLALNGGQWKHTTPLTTPAAGPRKSFPWWIPAAGIPVVGGVVYLTTRKRDQPTPTPPPPPVAVNDVVSLSCGGQTSINPLANDSGVRIALSGISAPAGISAAAVGSAVSISAIGAGTFSVPYTITDSLGRTASATITVTVLDARPPTITCPPATTISCDKEPDPMLTGQASATDDCPPLPNVIFSDQTLGPPCMSLILRTWTATDAAGKTATCSQNIQIHDTEPPFFTTTPPNITVPLGQQNNLEITGRAQATDACHPSAAEPSFTNSNLGPCGGTLLRLWTATDECGNTATYLQIITVVDTISPTITCPPPADVACGKQYDLDLTGRATATDDCDGPLTPTYADDPPSLPGCAGIIHRTWTATDPSGNTTSCVQTVAMNDTEAPFFTIAPPNITAPLGQQNNLEITGRAQAADACSPPAITPVFADDISNLKPCGGTLLRLWIAVDECGNTTTYLQTITVVDQMPPDITCPPPADVACGKQYDLDLTGRATATDNCADTVFVAYSDNPPAFSGCSGKIVRTWTGTDPTGNASSCTQEVGVTDNDPPVLVCPPNVTVNCGQQNNLSITGQAEAKDACANGASVTHTDQSTTFPTCINFIVGQVLRTFSSADSCGNSTTCLQTITIRDQMPPILTCPDVVQVQCGQQSNLNITGQPTTTDNCGGPVSITYSDNNTEFANCTGVIYRTFVATDPCGNTATCVQPIVVVNVPCDFTALFGVSTPVCGRCVGLIHTLTNPAGNYTYLWNTGHTTPDLNNVCPGTYTVSITHLGQECTDIFTVTVGNTPNLTLTILQVNHPTSPSANNGRVVLQVGPAPPWSIPPFLVFVNGAPIGTANTNTFQITNMPPGEYVIWVVDEGGGGCPSNEVFVFLIPGGLVGPPQLSLNASGAPTSPPVAGGPEHPAPTPATLWPATPGLSVALPIGSNGQVRLEYQPYLSLNPGGLPFVGTEQFSAGYRRYWPATTRHSDWLLFSESLLALTHLPPPSPTAARQQLPQLTAGGGIEGALGQHVRLETGLRLSILPTIAHYRWQWSAYLRAYLPIQGRQQPMSLLPAKPTLR